MNKQQLSLFYPLFLLFLVFSAIFFGAKAWWDANGFSEVVLLAGNFYVFFISVISLYFHIKGVLHKQPQAFLRNVYGAIMIKMFLSVGVVLVYALAAGNNLNKPGIFACMALYFIYTFVELRMVFRLLKQQKKHE